MISSKVFYKKTNRLLKLFLSVLFNFLSNLITQRYITVGYFFF